MEVSRLVDGGLVMYKLLMRCSRYAIEDMPTVVLSCLQKYTYYSS